MTSVGGNDMLDRDWLPNGAGLDRLLGKGESLQALDTDEI